VLVDDAVAEWYDGGKSELNAEMVEKYGPKELSGAASDPMAISFDNHQRQLEDFVQAVREGRSPAGRRPGRDASRRTGPGHLPVGADG